MLIIGKTDQFEQKYMTKFEQLATDYGFFVKYERDRAARDIGLHLTKDLSSGKKLVINRIVWFQMKGVMKKTLPAEKFEKEHNVSLSLEVEHLRHWFLENEPTHLVVYVEAVDKFLVMNLQSYVAEKWGREILSLEQKTATVQVPASSVLDEQAFAMLLREADIATWTKALGVAREEVEVVHRDYELIQAFATAEERGVEHEFRFWDWISKGRDQLTISERKKTQALWNEISGHWETGKINLEEAYPYLDFFSYDNYEPDFFINAWGEQQLDEYGRFITLKSGAKVFGPDCSGEFYEFVFSVQMNDYGRKLYEHVQQLIKFNLIEPHKHEKGMYLFRSVAPWHNRLV